MEISKGLSKSEQFHTFLTEFCERFKEKCQTNDSVPLRLPNPRVTPGEVEGECLEWCLEYLSSRGCPTGFSSLLSHDVYQQLAGQDLGPFLTEDTWRPDSPDQDDPNNTSIYIEYDAVRLRGHVLSLLEGVCATWLENFPVFNIDGHEPLVSYHAIKNSRRKMEDKHIIVQDLNALFGIKDQPAQAFYGVFDGHAGTDASMFAAKHIHCNLVHKCDLAGDPIQALKDAFRLTDEQFIPKAKKERWRSGSTGVVGLLRGSHLYLSWLGDSQAVLVRAGSTANTMRPHKPDRQDERERIQHAGGFVVKVGDLWRVGGNLAISRAIGDVQYKPCVSSEAEVQSLELDGSEEYVVLACDGLWDGLDPAQLPHVVFQYLAQHPGDHAGVARHLVKYAKDNDSQDNISVIVVFFTKALSEPITDTGLFNFLSGQGTQDNNDSGNDNSEAGREGSNDQGGDGGGNSPAGNTSTDKPMDSGEVCYNTDNETQELCNEASNISHFFDINHKSFMVPYFSQGSDHDIELETRRHSNTDGCGIFNSRLIDGPVDVDFTDESSSAKLLRDMAYQDYNDRYEDYENMPVTATSMASLKNYLKAEKVGGPGKRREGRRRGGKKHSSSPVFWAFTGNNKASVQNHKLNMAAKVFNKLSGENIPSVKPPPFKFAQKYSSAETVHDIPSVTLSHGRLDSLQQPLPRVLPGNLEKMGGVTMFGSRSALQKEAHKFHTMWRPRKPLKPISTVMYETPPTPFVNTKYGGVNRQN